MKTRAAFWTYGGIGAGLFSQGFPVLVKLIKALSERHDVVVFSMTTAANRKSLGFKIVCPPAWLKPNAFRWIYLLMIFSILQLIRPFDLLLAFWAYPAGFVAMGAGKLFRVPVIVSTLGAELANIPGIQFGLLRDPKLRKRIMATLRKASSILSISRFQTDIIRTLPIDRPVHVIPWGAEPLVFSFQQKSWEELRILHVANLTEVKDQETLIRAFAKITEVRPAQLKIVGADFMNGRIQSLVKGLHLGDSVTFIGAVPYESIGEHFAWANVMMHTSVFEGHSMAVAEGAASGLLIAGTRVGAMSDLGDDGAICVEPGQWQELAARMLDVLSRPEECRKKVLAARRWSTLHDFAWTVNQYDEVMMSTAMKRESR